MPHSSYLTGRERRAEQQVQPVSCQLLVSFQPAARQVPQRLPGVLLLGDHLLAAAVWLVDGSKGDLQ